MRKKGNFCAKHKPVEVVEEPTRILRSKTKANLVEVVEEPTRILRSAAKKGKISAGYFKQQSVSTKAKGVYQKVKEIVDKTVANWENCPTLNSGVRKLLHLETKDAKRLKPHLLKMMKEMKEKVGFPLRKPVIAHAPYVVVAPGVGNKSNWWTMGTIHRDFKETDVRGAYTYILFLDEVTDENGAIEIWEGSKKEYWMQNRKRERYRMNA